MNASAITPDAVAKHLAALLGVNVTAKKGQPADLKGTPVVCIVDDAAGELACLIHFDVAGAASTGAALSRIPAGAVKDALRNGLDEGLLANFQEIANVLTVLTTAALGNRSVLRGVKQGKDSEDPKLRAFASGCKTRIHVQLSVSGYSDGNCAFLLP